MRLPNHYGSVSKINGKRRKPYVVRLAQIEYICEESKDIKTRRPILGYATTREEGLQMLANYNNYPCNEDLLNMTFGELLDFWFSNNESKWSKATIRSYSAAAKHCQQIKKRRIRDIKFFQLQNVINLCERGSETKNNIKIIISSVYQLAIKYEIVRTNLGKELEVPPVKSEIVRQVFTNEEVKSLDDNSVIDCITKILLYTGMRINELLTLNKSDCDLDNRILSIRASKTSSGIREVPIHTELIPIITKFMQQDGCVYMISNNKKKVTYDHYKKNLANHLPHDTRHTFATRVNECGLDELLIKKIIGHSINDITQKVYTHIKSERLVDEIDKLNYDVE